MNNIQTQTNVTKVTNSYGQKVRTATKAQKEQWLAELASHILMITFTDAASKETGARIAGQALYRGLSLDVSAMPVLTFNAFYMDTICKFYKEIGYKVAPRVLDVDPIAQSDKLTPMITGNNQLSGVDYNIPVTANMFNYKGALAIATEALNVLRSTKAETVDELADALEDNYKVKRYVDSKQWELFLKDILSLASDYDDLLKAEGLLTFADQETLGLSILDLNPDYLKELGFWHVVIDEFQDSNEFNMALVELLQACRDIHGGSIKSIMVIGDGDQSIYGFRSAKVENFTRFEDKIHSHKGLENDVIERKAFKNCYRLTDEVAELANRFVEQNEKRKPKTIISKKGHGLKVSADGYLNLQEEIDAIVEEAIKVKKAQPDWSICFMAHNRATLDKIKIVVDEKGYSSLLKAPTEVINNTRVMAAISFFKCFDNLDDTQGIYDYLTVVTDNKFKELPKEEQNDMIINLRAEVTNVSSKNVYVQRQMLHKYLDDLDKTDEIYMSWKNMIYNSALIECQKEGSINNEPFHIYNTIRKFVQFGQDVKAKLQKEYKADFILQTAHSSKGLEYDCVFLVTDDFVNSELFGRNAKTARLTASKTTTTYEELRRLLFVAMTRAKEKLYITGSIVAKKDKKFGNLYNPFLEEIMDIMDEMEYPDATRTNTGDLWVQSLGTTVPRTFGLKVLDVEKREMDALEERKQLRQKKMKDAKVETSTGLNKPTRTTKAKTTKTVKPKAVTVANTDVYKTAPLPNVTNN